MKTTITHAERLRVAEWMLDAQQLLAGVETLEGQIAKTLGFGPDDSRDPITDAISVPLTVDQLLADLHIGIQDETD
jgi:hypothetical protein